MSGHAFRHHNQVLAVSKPFLAFTSFEASPKCHSPKIILSFMGNFLGQQRWHSNIVFTYGKKFRKVPEWNQIMNGFNCVRKHTIDIRYKGEWLRRRLKRQKVNLIKVIKAEEQSRQTLSRRKEFPWNLLRELLSIQFTSSLAWLSVAKREFWTCESRKRFFFFPRDSYFMDERNFSFLGRCVCVQKRGESAFAGRCENGSV